jgi:N-acetylneuraminic acid mutarotase
MQSLGVTYCSKKSNHNPSSAPDGHSLVMFGGFSTTNTSIIYDDIWVVDTCSLSWEKKTISGTAPVGRAGHSAVRVGNYMIIVGGTYFA